MRTWLLIVAVGAAAAGLHAIGGFLLTPFFGSAPLFWAHVLASLPLSIALGLILGQPVSTLFGPVPARIGVTAGLLVGAVPLALPHLARAILDRDPDAPWAAAVAVLALLTFPATTACAVLPGLVAEGREASGRLSGRIVRSQGASLLGFALGASLGVGASTPALAPGGEAVAWIAPVALGALLALVAASRLGALGRATSVLLAGAVTAAGALLPGEVHDFEFQKALAQAWTLRVGRYYLATARRPVLAETEVLARYDELIRRIERREKVAPVLVVETLRGMGAVRITGAGLRRLLDLHLPAAAKPHVMPFLERVEVVNSDGQGTIALSLRWDDGDREIRVTAPTAEGGTTTFIFTADPEVTLSVQETPEAVITTIGFGPVEVERAGFLARNDTMKTPVLVENAVLFLNAWLHNLVVEDRADRVIVRVRAQASVGAPSEKVLQVIEK